MRAGGDVDEVVFLFRVEGVAAGEVMEGGVDLLEIPGVLELYGMGVDGGMGGDRGNVGGELLRQFGELPGAEEFEAVDGEVGMAAILAGIFAVPAGCFLAGRTEMTLAFTGAAMIFLPSFVFLPKIIRQAMLANTDTAIEAFGKNEQVKKVFWAVFSALAGIVLAQVLDPVTAQQIVEITMGMAV